MNRKFFAIPIAILIAAAAASFHSLDAAPAKTAPKKNMAYKLPLDEKMVYAVKAFGISIATQTNTTRGIIDRGGKKTVNIFSGIKSHKWVALVSINNSMETFIDAATLSPVFYEEKASESDWAAVEKVEFLADRAKYHALKGKKLDEEQKVETKYKTAEGPQDELSLIYRVRQMGLTPGKTFTLPAWVDDKLETVVIKVVKKQQMKTIHGTKEVFYLTSTLGDSKFYVGADDKKIPYKFDVKLNFGYISAVLKEYSPQP